MSLDSNRKLEFSRFRLFKQTVDVCLALRSGEPEQYSKYLEEYNGFGANCTLLVIPSPLHQYSIKPFQEQASISLSSLAVGKALLQKGLIDEASSSCECSVENHLVKISATALNSDSIRTTLSKRVLPTTEIDQDGDSGLYFSKGKRPCYLVQDASVRPGIKQSAAVVVLQKSKEELELLDIEKLEEGFELDLFLAFLVELVEEELLYHRLTLRLGQKAFSINYDTQQQQLTIAGAISSVFKAVLL